MIYWKGRTLKELRSNMKRYFGTKEESHIDFYFDNPDYLYRISAKGTHFLTCIKKD